MLETRAADRGLAIRHVVGERFASGAPAARDGHGGVIYQPVAYEPDMPLVYAAADLLVGRGGASTVHEVAATGIPAILVPWTGAAEDHQTANVAWLADAGGAVLLPERQIDELPALIERLRSDPAAPRGAGRPCPGDGEVHRSGALRVAGGSRGSSLIGPCPCHSPIDLARQQPAALVGVGGPGMSAIALALAQRGHRLGQRPARTPSRRLRLLESW